MLSLGKNELELNDPGTRHCRNPFILQFANNENYTTISWELTPETSQLNSCNNTIKTYPRTKEQTKPANSSLIAWLMTLLIDNTRP